MVVPRHPRHILSLRGTPEDTKAKKNNDFGHVEQDGAVCGVDRMALTRLDHLGANTEDTSRDDRCVLDRETSSVVL